MRPESGLIKPLASLRRTLFPTPAGPSRMRVSPRCTSKERSSRTSLPSNPMETCSKRTAGASGCTWLGGVSACRARSAMGSYRLLLESPANDADHELADHKVHRDNKHRGDDDCLRRGPANALSTTGCAHAVVAPDGGDNKTKDERLHQALRYVPVAQCLVRSVEILRGVLS